MYDRGVLRAHPLGRPTIGVGNLTTGGTGKTPVVQWLATALRAAGHRPAILMRGYKGARDIDGSLHGDEQSMLEFALSRQQPAIPVIANPNRLRGAGSALAQRPDVDVFVLDDAFQHRRARREFDLVLVNAAAPFGFGHVLPRGLLREPLTALRRADAVLITHASEAGSENLAGIESVVRDFNADASLQKCDHELTALCHADGTTMPMTALADRSYFVACAIGSPDSFVRGLADFAGRCVGRRFLPDHHPLDGATVRAIQAAARSAKAEWVLVTEKDWAKIAHVKADPAGPPVVRVQMGLRFWGDDERALLKRITAALPPPSPAASR
jgi:tetraacyldisaccharide 4'-kinase